MKVFSLILATVVMASCAPEPHVYGTFVEKSIAVPSLGGHYVKREFRAAGWKLNVKNSNSSSVTDGHVTLHRNNATSRYTMDYGVSNTGYNLWSGNNNDPIEHITIFDNKNGEEMLNYSGADITSANGATRLIKAVNKYTAPNAK